MSFKIQPYDVLPGKLSSDNSIGSRLGKSKYPFGDLPIGSFFAVPVKDGSKPSMVYGNLQRCAKSYVKANEVTDRAFVVRHVRNADGSFALDEQGRRQIGVYAVQPETL
jgi:hypothetical protein